MAEEFTDTSREEIISVIMQKLRAIDDRGLKLLYFFVTSY